MIDATTEFFDELARRSHEPLLEKAKATIRFDIVQGKRKRGWLVSIDRGDVTVSRKSASADSIVRADQALFERLISGQANAMAEVLRGTLTVSGDLEPMMLFQRLFPGPPLAKARR
jgi:predicted lipid carrier protein YhbT